MRGAVRVMGHRAAVIALWTVAIAIATVLAARLPQVLQGGADAVPGTESEHVTRAVGDAFGTGALYQFLVVVHSESLGTDAPEFGDAMAGIARALQALAQVRAVETPWNSDRPELLGDDGRSALAVVTPRVATFYQAERLTATLRTTIAQVERPAGLAADVTGSTAMLYDLDQHSSSDLLAAERIGLPVTLVILLVVFGAPLAAALPLLLAMAATAIGLAGLYAASAFTPVSVFAENVTCMIGLGVGIDYALFVLSRFREARARGLDPTAAAAEARRAAGHSVTFSGATVVVGFLALFLVRAPFLHTIAVGGIVVVAAAVAATMTLLPTVLGLLGPAVDWPRRRTPSAPEAVEALAGDATTGPGATDQAPEAVEALGGDATTGRPETRAAMMAERVEEERAEAGCVGERARVASPARASAASGAPAVSGAPAASGAQRQTFWAAWAHAVMQRPILALLVATAVLTTLILPVTRLRAWNVGPASLPPDTESRRGYDALEDRFPRGWMGPIVLLFQARPGESVLDPRQRRAVVEVANELRGDPRSGTLLGVPQLLGRVGALGPPIASLDSLPQPIRAAARAVVSQDGRVAIAALVTPGEPGDAATMSTLRELRARRFPAAEAAGLTLAWGGSSAVMADFDDELFGRLPWVVAAVVAITFVVLTLLFRAPLIAFKATLLNTASVLAAYGFLVLVFQDGLGAAWIGLDPPGGLNSFIVLMLFTILFGLSMDYEVFLLARVREEYLIDGDNDRAVAVGLARTGGIITSAALIMISIFAAFGFTRLVATREFGLGLAFAVALDASLIRVVLVPALMKLAGRANWWWPFATKAKASR